MTSRRQFLKTTAAAAAAPLAWTKPSPNLHVGIVGAGLAGLACAYELKRFGINATVYEANTRAGGRVWSMPFNGQVIERGGELIDTAHKMMLGYAREFGLTLENFVQQPGETAYFFNGQHYTEAQIVAELRAFVPAMRDDLRKLSAAPTADVHTEADRQLDHLSLAEYLTSRGAGGLLYEVIQQAYIAEYGLEIEEQSCLNFLFFMRANRRSRFEPFGGSDERYHIVEGNQRVPDGLAGRLHGQIAYDHKLTRVSKTPAGGIGLEFAGKASRSHDYVVLTAPFTVLRSDVQLDANLDLPGWKQAAIAQLGYGMNAKMMVGFNGRPWAGAGSNGASYSDLANHQATWETNPTRGTAGRATLVDYSGGIRGASLDPGNPQGEAIKFLGDLNFVYAGAFANAVKDGGGYRVHLEHWPSNPLTKGSYTCYKPGQFTTIAGNEGKAVGNLLFAGEHANSFYEFQGFMEGALLSGVAAAQQIVRPKR